MAKVLGQDPNTFVLVPNAKAEQLCAELKLIDVLTNTERQGEKTRIEFVRWAGRGDEHRQHIDEIVAKY